MTTITWDGKTLAADSRVTAGGSLVAETAVKIKKIDNKLVGAAGVPAQCEEFFEFVKSGEKPEQLPEDFQGVIVYKNKRIEYYDSNYSCTLCKGLFSIGSGEEYAYGAMSAGASAKEAIKIAMKKDLATGGKIIELSFK